MRHRADKLRNYQIAKLQNRRSHSRGYILITLMLFFALLAIAAMAVLPEIAFQIKRDREEEMIHRALEYSRAVKRYYKKFGRYPSRIEELENTNNIRFLRKRYKDPITGKDFKILHLTDIMLNSGPAMGQPTGQPQGAFNPKVHRPRDCRRRQIPQTRALRVPIPALRRMGRLTRTPLCHHHHHRVPVTPRVRRSK